MADKSTVTVTEDELVTAEDLSEGRVVTEPAPTKTQREYRLELFEEGNNRSQARVRGLAREGWEFPTIHGFVRNLTMNRGTDRFFIVVASRDTEVPG